MFALYRLQAKVWFANFFNKIDFIMVVLFLSVMGSMVAMRVAGATTDEGTYEAMLSQANIAIISSITLMMVASSSINTFGMSFFEMKESVLLKRIGATNITKPKAVGSFILWGMTSMFMILAWMFLIVGIFQIPASPDTFNGLLWVSKDVWAQVDWFGVIFAIIIVMISFYAIAFFFVSINKNSTGYQMLATFYFFLVAMLGGSFTPNADRTWMEVIGFLSPLGWGGNIMTAAMHGQDWFNIIDGFAPTFGADGATGIKAAANIFMPIVYGTLAGLASFKFFKWD